MSAKDSKSNKRILRVILAGIAVLILCGALCGAAAANQGPFPDDGVLENGTYILTDNVALANNLTVPDGVTCTINLAGYVLRGNGTGPVITISGTGDLTLKDENADHTPAARPHYFTFVSDDKWKYIHSPESSVDLANFDLATAAAAPRGTYHVKVTGGVITNGDNKFAGGGGVRVGNTAGDMSKFTMDGGNIVGNSAMLGGGVDVIYGSRFIMNAGNIVGNSALYGGGVNVEDGGTSAAMNGGNIIGNNASCGGGVSIAPGKGTGSRTFTMNNGTIVGNGANLGGGVYVEPGRNEGIFIMKGGKISGNIVADGGEVCDGGGVCVKENGKFTVSGNSVIKENKKGTNANNLVLGLEDDEELEFILAGPFTGDIRITSVYGKAPVKGEQFGTAEKEASGAKNITADGSSLFGSISADGKLIWTVKKSSSSSQGTSIWLTATQTPEPTPTATPTPTPVPTPDMPTVKPTAYPTPTPASPAPFPGILAGLGAAAVLFGLRRK